VNIQSRTSPLAQSNGNLSIIQGDALDEKRVHPTSPFSDFYDGMVYSKWIVVETSRRLAFFGSAAAEHKPKCGWWLEIIPNYRVEVETQEKGNIGNKPGFFACFVSKKQ